MKQRMNKKLIAVLVSLVLVFQLISMVNANTDLSAVNNDNKIVVVDASSELKIGDEFALEVSVNQAGNIMQLPEGIEYIGNNKNIELDVESNSLVITNENAETINIRLRASAAGSFSFQVVNNETEDKSNEVSVNVKSEEEVIEDIKTDIEDSLKPVLAETNGSVTVEFVGYEDAAGLDSKMTLVVNVHFDFGDTTSTGKRVEFTIPEGLKYSLIEVGGIYNTANVDPTIYQEFPDASPIKDSIIKVTLPTRESLTLPNSYTKGTVVYEFSPVISSGTLTFKIKTDNAKYYGPTTLKNAVIAKAYKGSPSQELGIVEKMLSLNGAVAGSGRFYVYSPATSSAEVTQSTATIKEYGRTSNSFLMLEDPAAGLDSDYRYIKNSVMYLYYPQGMKFAGIEAQNNSINENNSIIVDDPVNSRIIITYTANQGWHTSLNAGIKYEVPENIALGEYKHSAKDYVEYETFDGVKHTVYIDNDHRSVKVVEKSKNVIGILHIHTGYYENSTDSTHVKFLGHVGFANNTAGTKTNQVIEFNFGQELEVYRIHLPWNDTQNTPPVDAYFKTNLKTDWVEYQGEYKSWTKYLVYVDAEMLGLAEGEYITDFKANMGSFETGYISYDPGGSRSHQSVTYLGKLKPGYSSGTAVVSAYDADDKINNIVTGTVSSLASESGDRKTVSQTSLDFFNEEGIKSGSITAGESMTIKGNISLASYPYGSVSFMNAPEIYIREQSGTTLVIDELVLKDLNTNTVITGWTYSLTEINGEKIYKIKTPTTVNIGHYTKNKILISQIQIDAKFETVSTLTGTINLQDIFGIGKPGIEAYPSPGVAIHPVVDVHDLNANGNKTELMLTASPKTLVIQENRNVLVNTFLTLAGEEPKAPYVEGNDSTVAMFTPGTLADYKVLLLNNGDKPAHKVDTYIPIPKTGENFGPLFQPAAFMWNTKLNGPVVLPVELAGKYKIMYAVGANEANYRNDGIYTETPANYDDVNMVKLVSITPIGAGDSAELTISLKVDETFDTATEGNKIGTRNVYNPVMDIVSDNYTGDMYGTKVGTDLVIAEIGGLVFEDVDADGLFTVGTDTPIAGHEVRLYLLNETTQKYEPVESSPGVRISVTTNVDGIYLFDYQEGLGYGTYAVEFVEKGGGVYQYTVNNPVDKSRDSDAIIANGIPTASDNYRGWAIGIDATRPEAKTIGAGFLLYNPPVDLTVQILNKPRTVLDTGSISIPLTDLTITPVFFENIKAETGAYVWTATVGGDKVTLSTLADGSVIITGKALTSGTAEVKLTLTIKDIYGQVATSNAVTVTVISSTAPTVAGADLEVFVGDTTDFLTGLTAKNNAGSAIVVTTTNTTVNSTTVPVIANKYTTAGTYSVSYIVKDENGIEGTYSRLVKVTGLPEITAPGQIYALGSSDIVDKVTAAGTAKYMAAPAAVGAAVETAITPTFTIKSGPVGANNFDTVGLYKVEYSASVAGKMATKEVDVLITTDGAVQVGSVIIDAQGFVIENVDAAGLNDVLSKDADHGNVTAYVINKTNDVITSITPALDKVTVDAIELAAINAVDTKGGTLSLTFSVKNGADEANKPVVVVVKGTNVEVNNGLALTATGFVIENSEAAGLDNTAIIDKSSAKAVVIETSENVTDIKADLTQLAAIKAATTAGGIFELDLVATHDGKTVTKTITVVVKGSGVIVENGIAIEAASFAIENEDAATLDDAKAQSDAKVKAVVVETNEEITDIVGDVDQLKAINEVDANGDILPLVFTATFEGKTAIKEVLVTVRGIGIVELGNIVLKTDSSIVLAYHKGVALTAEELLVLTSAKAYNTVTLEPITINIDQTEITAINEVSEEGGTFVVNYVVTDGVDTITKPVNVEVLKNTKYSIEANDIVINKNDLDQYVKAEQLETKIIELGKVKGYEDSSEGIKEIPITLEGLEQLSVAKAGDVVTVTAKLYVDNSTASTKILPVGDVVAEHTFTVTVHESKSPSTGISNQYVLYSLILLGGMAALVASKKLRKEEV